MENMKKITCPNCGAAFYEKEPKCPFCGYINFTGAEEKFMRDVKQTEEDMSQIPKLQEEELKKTVSGKSMVVIVTIVIVIGLILVLLGVQKIGNAVEENSYTYDKKAEMLWEQENYPLLDEMYEAGDYDGLVKYSGDLYDYNKENKTHHSMVNWEHYDFITAYTNYNIALNLIKDLDAGVEPSEYTIKNFVYHVLWFYTGDYEEYYQTYSEAELAMIEEYRTELAVYMLERFGYTQEELNQLAEEVTPEGYLDFEACDAYTKENLERFKIQ